MAKDTSFQLDIEAAGRIILQEMAAPIVELSAKAIATRADGMGAALSGNAPGFNVTTRVGTIKRGNRAIATVSASESSDLHQNYVARTALIKAKDAGRVN